ncbi:cytochrome c biogenesis (thiol:disulfide interchange protein) [Oceanobacillus iheyensis HTE831]|uniref:Cytochrome c biogenesis (Thiol:disulfide interchange protein) n=1 Tax=Oceanobacillus iheyensis (strain DSM 14371 / CIP 107618 / JCM 11309 / KCTC 3954 / HTE831) TaxID=221109 RepID=Q8CXG2_OCEIH|nr:cytochrome c biogenesis (thiol:disulfide interchange protein) [Oceanobacillus iheyensis HTE831]
MEAANLFKKIFGFMLLLVLVGLLLGNIIQSNYEDNHSDTDYHVTGDDNMEGGSIAPVDSVGLEPGDKAPDFELETLEGESFRLSDYQGKKVILNFWYTWCPPCKEEMPEMQEFYDDYKEEVEIVTVNMTEYEKTQQNVQDFIDEYDFTFTVPLDKNSEVSDLYTIYAAPSTYFIGTDGIVQQERKIGPMDYEFMQEMVEGIN